MHTGYKQLSAVDDAKRFARTSTFRGNTFGQLDCYYKPSVADRESAARFNSAAAWERAIKARRAAGLDVNDKEIT
jgi:hypothetical protein